MNCSDGGSGGETALEAAAAKCEDADNATVATAEKEKEVFKGG